MTREQILAMQAGRELDALVAEKVMGLEVGLIGRVFQTAAIKKSESVWEKLLYYSTDISAAWQVSDRIPLPNMTLYNYRGTASADWICAVYACNEYGDTETEHEATGTTAPEAICKAALLAAFGNQ